VSVARLLRDSLVFEEGDTLCLARGADRSWLARGPLGGSGLGSHFGPVSYTFAMADADHVNGEILLTEGRQPGRLHAHLRLPNGRKITAVDDPHARMLPDGETLEWTKPAASLRFTATIR